MALKHTELYYVLKTEQNHSIPSEIESLISNPQELNKSDLLFEIKNLWIKYKKSKQVSDDKF